MLSVLKYVYIPATFRLEKSQILKFYGLKDFLSGFFQAMQGKNGANTDVFASILTKQWRKNPSKNGLGY